MFTVCPPTADYPPPKAGAGDGLIVLPKEGGGLQGCAFNEKQVAEWWYSVFFFLYLLPSTHITYIYAHTTCICTYTHTHITCVCILICICVHICVYVKIYRHTYAYTQIFIHSHIYTQRCMFLFVCTYTCTHTSMHAHIYMYTFPPNSWFSYTCRELSEAR